MLDQQMQAAEPEIAQAKRFAEDMALDLGAHALVEVALVRISDNGEGIDKLLAATVA
ncbi:MAG: hypothetical protein ABSB34_09935 [Candidatus Limnocylindrales bacterium]